MSSFRAPRENKNSSKITTVSGISSIGANTGRLNQTAMMAGGSPFALGDVAYGSPKFYSPIHTPSNWQIPTKRREVYLWNITENSELMQDDFTFLKAKNLVSNFFVYDSTRNLVLSNIVNNSCDSFNFTPSSITKDTLTDGIIYENVLTRQRIYGGIGELRKPIHISKQNIINKENTIIKVYGNHRSLDVSSDHPIYFIKKSEVKSKAMKHKALRGSKKSNLSMKDFYYNNQWNILREKAGSDRIQNGDFLLTPIPKLLDNKYYYLSNDFCWLIGQALADGSLIKPQNGSCYVDFNCSKNEPSTIKNIKRILTDIYGKYKCRTHTNSNNCERISVYSNRAYEDLSLFIDGKLTQKKLTKEVLHLNKEQLLHLIGGYLDGDGYFLSKDKNVHADSTSVHIIDQIYYLSLINNINCSTNKENFVIKNNKYIKNNNVVRTKYKIAFSRSASKKLGSYMVSGKIPTEILNKNIIDHNSKFFFNDKKTNTEYLAQPISKITKYLYSGVGYDLQIDPERSYVCSGYKVSNCRFFASNEPKVASALDIYSQLPVTDFENVCEDETVTAYYDELDRQLKINDWLPRIAYEYFCIGDVFIFANVACKICGGSGIVPGSLKKDGSYIPCAHEGGTFHSLTMLSPDWVEVVSSFVTNEEVIFIVPSNDLKNIVQRRSPPEIYNRIPPFVKQAVELGKPIQLHPMCVTHLAHNRSGTNPYGRSLVTRLFRTLAYKDKIVQAQWIVADRHILPVRIVKIGSEAIPANEQDIQAVRQQLLQINQDPSFTLITPHAFEYDFVGACHDDVTQVLTMNGWKNYNDVRTDDKIMVFDPKTESMMYEKIINRFEYDYDGELIHFANSGIDMMVTPNHKMLFCKNKKEKWMVDEARNLTQDRYIFRASADWKSNQDIDNISIDIKEDLQTNFGTNVLKPKDIEINTFMKFLGYYLSEGYVNLSTKGRSYQVSISQKIDSPFLDDIRKNIQEVSKQTGIKLNEHVTKSGQVSFTLSNKYFAYYMSNNFGSGSYNKKIPSWIKNLPKKRLSILLKSFNNGDASKSLRPNGNTYYQIRVFSEQLSEDIYEIAFKCGLATKMSYLSCIQTKDADFVKCVNITEGTRGKFPTIKKSQINMVPYRGKVWCFETSTGFFVTRRNGKIGIHGNSGKVMQLGKEYDMIDQEILDGLMINKALLNGEGPCFDPSVEILTENGWKKYTDVLDNEKLATFNPKNNSLEYQNFINRIVRDYNGDLIHFKTNEIDMLTTTNHRMWGQEEISINENQEPTYSDWKVIPAEEVKYKTRMRACVDKWIGTSDQYINNGIVAGNYLIHDINAFSALVGYYISYGHYDNEEALLNVNKKYEGVIRKTLIDVGITFVESPNNETITFLFDKDFSKWIGKQIHNDVGYKNIPSWIKQFSKEQLECLFGALFQKENYEKNSTEQSHYSYSTSSKQLADDIMEIALKLGYAVTIGQTEDQKIYVTNIFYSNKNRFPVLDTLIFGEKEVDRRKCIQKIPYNGKVWCFEVPNEFLIVRRNGIPLVAGNTYNSASVGLEAFIKRLESFRNVLKRFLEEKIYRPVAMMQGFTTTNERNQEVLMYPTVKFKEMRLRDDTQVKNLYMQMSEKKFISKQTFLELFDIDFDVEIERMRMENIIESEYNLSDNEEDGGAGGAGGIGEIMPDIGGGGGGAGGGGEMPEISGAPEGGGPEIGGGPEASMPMMSKQSQPQNIWPINRPKVSKKKQNTQISLQKRPKLSKKELEALKPKRLILNIPEQKMFRAIENAQKSGNIKQSFFPQFRPDPNKRYRIDFAFPKIKLGIEIDGPLHDTPEKIREDKEKDQYLQKNGWYIHRFKEKEINNNLNNVVVPTLIKLVQERTKNFTSPQ